MLVPRALGGALRRRDPAPLTGPETSPAPSPLKWDDVTPGAARFFHEHVENAMRLHADIKYVGMQRARVEWLGATTGHHEDL